MATINGLLSSGYSASSSKVYADTKKEIQDLRDKMNTVDKDSSLTVAERTEQKKKYQEELASLKENINSTTTASMESAASNASNIVSSMFGVDSSGKPSTDTSMFFGASASLSSLSAVNSARVSIENRARTLTSEIAMDKLRGVNTSSKQEKLTNLTSNLEIMDGGLNKDIDKALDTSE